MTDIHTVPLECGLTLVAEPIDNVASLALRWLLPIGAAGDPADREGHSAMLAELVFRGAGALSSREHSDALDRIGVRRSSHTTSHHLHLDFTMLGDRVEEAMPLLVSLVREPAIPEDAIEPVRSLCLQSLASLDDDPQHLSMLRLREHHLPPPFNRHGYGDGDALASMTGEELREAWGRRARPGAAIIAAAGRLDPAALAGLLDERLGGWAGDVPEPTETGQAIRGMHHIDQETAQVHIALAHDAPRAGDEDSPVERLTIAVLSGSTSGRLFSEVRQKRSLCYSVGASYQGGRDRGLVSLYAGTTPERAQETLDVCMGEIHRLAAGVEREEFDRAVIGLKSHLIMQGESTTARAGALASDQFRLGRARTLDEIATEIDGVSLDDLNAYVARREIGMVTAVTIGPAPLRLPDASAPSPVRL